MLYEIDNETIDFLCEHKLTLNQFAICLLIHKKDTATMIRINTEIGKIGNYLIPNGVDTQGKKRYIKEIDDLIDRNFLRLTFIDKENKYALDNFEVTSKFTDEFINKLDLAADEFFDNYPKNIFVKGIEYPARACDYQDMKIAYIKGIKSSIKRHKEVIAGLKQDLELSPYAKANIMNYIGGRMWENRQEETKVKTRGY